METARRIAPDFAWNPPPVRSSLLGAGAGMLQANFFPDLIGRLGWLTRKILCRVLRFD